MDWKKEVKFYKDYPKLKRDSYLLISKIINDSNKIDILDFGCGDGKLIKFLDSDRNIYLYDINTFIVQQIISRYIDRKFSVFKKIEDIPHKKFDAIICSLVLMCISNKKEFIEIVDSFFNFLKKDSILLVLITHPAFRKEKFSYFQTELDNSFNYFDEGKAYKVFF